MRKLRDIPRAEGNAVPGDPDWDKDELIAALEAQGHTPISIDRGLVRIDAELAQLG